MKQLISYRKPSFKPYFMNQLQTTLYKDKVKFQLYVNEKIVANS